MKMCMCMFVTWLVKTREVVLFMLITAVLVPAEVVSQD